MKRISLVFTIAVTLAMVGSASAQLVWGPGVDVLVDASINEVHPTAEFGFAPFEFNSLTVTGGYLEGDRIYGGSVQDHVINISGGHLKDAGGVTILGYDNNTTLNLSGGILESTSFVAIGRNGATTEVNMTGGQWLIGSDPPHPNGNVYMPGNDPDCCGGYGTPGVLNFFDGEIVIQVEDWSASGFDILNQPWFNTFGAVDVSFDGSATTITPDMSGCGNGDADANGVVDEVDLRILLDHYFVTSPVPGPCEGNFNFDPTVDEQDYLIWETEFVNSGGVVPEPSSLVMLIPAALVLLSRGRRQRTVAR